ncbi:MAG: hypothetical protein KF777_16185 [Planctomycetaceae bacterium]|nr:hypothetical protein [Planctomycetaceae bacterium]
MNGKLRVLIAVTLAGVLAASGMGCARSRSAHVAENWEGYRTWWRATAEKPEGEIAPEAVVSANLSIHAAEADLDSADPVKQASANENPWPPVTGSDSELASSGSFNAVPALSLETAGHSLSGAGTNNDGDAGSGTTAPPTSNSIERLQASLKEEVSKSPADSSEADSEIRYRVESILERARDSLLGKDFATARRLAENANRLVNAVNLPFRPEEERPVDLLREIESIEVSPRAADFTRDVQTAPGQPTEISEETETELAFVRSAANGAARLSSGSDTYDPNEPLLPDPSQEPIQTRPLAQSAFPAVSAAPATEPWFSPLDRVQGASEALVAVDPPVLPAPKWTREADSPEPVAVTLRDLGAASTEERALSLGTPRQNLGRDWISLFASIAAFAGVGYGFVSWILGRLRSP